MDNKVADRKIKPTPGPWAFEKFSFGSPDAPISHKKIVGPPYGPHGARNLIAEIHMQHESHEADGQLIAATPELLDAAKAFVRWVDACWGAEEILHPDTLKEYEAAKSAIRKATGVTDES